MTEFLTAVRVGDVDLYRGNPHGFHGVQKGHAGVGVGGGVDDYAVHLFKIGLLDGVHQCPFMVGLKETDLHSQPVRLLLDHSF